MQRSRGALRGCVAAGLGSALGVGLAEGLSIWAARSYLAQASDLPGPGSWDLTPILIFLFGTMIGGFVAALIGSYALLALLRISAFRATLVCLALLYPFSWALLYYFAETGMGVRLPFQYALPVAALLVGVLAHLLARGWQQVRGVRYAA